MVAETMVATMEEWEVARFSVLVEDGANRISWYVLLRCRA